MDTEEINETPDAAIEESEVKSEEKTSASPKPLWAKWATALALVCALAAWALLLFSDTASIAFAVASLGFSIAGVCGLKRSFMRDVSITCLIASAILLFVYALFFFGIKFALSSI